MNPLDGVFLAQPVLNLSNSSTVGIRYDIAAFAALKAEYRNWRRTAVQPRNYGGYLQVSFTF